MTINKKGNDIKLSRRLTD